MEFPIGSIFAKIQSIPGSVEILFEYDFSDKWVEMKGQIIKDKDSSLYGIKIPNIEGFFIKIK